MHSGVNTTIHHVLHTSRPQEDKEHEAFANGVDRHWQIIVLQFCFDGGLWFGGFS